MWQLKSLCNKFTKKITIPKARQVNQHAPFVYCVLGLTTLLGCTTKEEVVKPNILYIMADDHTAQAWGVYGGILKDYVHTPNIDRLADDGCVLENCLVSNSICTPSRATILTGQYSHVNGVKTLGSGFKPEHNNIAKVLSAGGYQTSVIGKWHLQTEPTGFDYYCVLPGQGRYWKPKKTGDITWRGEKSIKVLVRMLLQI